ncbi:MAG: hypothetical protein KAS57_00895 [Gammaproteobacteria bacterium]|nr:hypothetical protein [Gammaproteobacteria bacterium]
MNENAYNILIPILKDFFFIIGITLFFISLVVGVLLLIKPAIIFRFNKQAGTKFSMRHATKFLEVPYVIDPLFYKHHRIVGAIVTLISGYILYYFSLVYDAALIAEYVKDSVYAIALDILVNALRVFMLFTSVFIVLIGIVIFVRPSQIKSVEAWANRWISTRQASRKLSVERDQVNLLAYKYPRITGMIIVLLSLYALILLLLVYT